MVQQETLVSISQLSLPPHISMLRGYIPAVECARHIGAEKIQLWPTRAVVLDELYTGGVFDRGMPFDLHWSGLLDTHLEGNRKSSLRNRVFRRLLFPRKSQTDDTMVWLIDRFPQIPITVHSLGYCDTLGRVGHHPLQVALAPVNNLSFPELWNELQTNNDTLGISFPVENPHRREDTFTLWRSHKISSSDPYRRYSWSLLFEKLQPHIRSLRVGPITENDLSFAKEQGTDTSKLSSVERHVVHAYNRGFIGDVVIDSGPQHLLGAADVARNLTVVVGRYRKLRDIHAKVNLSEV